MSDETRLGLTLTNIAEKTWAATGTRRNRVPWLSVHYDKQLGWVLTLNVVDDSSEPFGESLNAQAAPRQKWWAASQKVARVDDVPYAVATLYEHITAKLLGLEAPQPRPVTGLPPSIQQALNSGDGTYKPLPRPLLSKPLSCVTSYGTRTPGGKPPLSCGTRSVSCCAATPTSPIRACAWQHSHEPVLRWTKCAGFLSSRKERAVSKAFSGVVLFTAIEIGTMVGWLALVLAGRQVLGAVVLSVGLFIEHYVSVNVGAGRRPFGPLPPDR